MVKRLIDSPVKLVYLILGVAFLVLGIIGLVFPLIPGLLFLAAAIWVLGKVSRRIRAWSANSPTFVDMEKRAALLGGVGGWDRIRLGTLMLLDSAVRGVDAVAGRVRRMRGR